MPYRIEQRPWRLNNARGGLALARLAGHNLEASLKEPDPVSTLQ
jgi:hypothetical protein